MKFALRLLLSLFIVVSIYGCKATESVRIEYKDSIIYRNHIDSVMIYDRDSVIVKQQGDTVYVEKWRTKYIDKINIRTDTAYIDRVRTEKQIIKEKYVPAFYKWCLFITILLISVVIIYSIWKIYKRVKY